MNALTYQQEMVGPAVVADSSATLWEPVPAGVSTPGCPLVTWEPINSPNASCVLCVSDFMPLFQIPGVIIVISQNIMMPFTIPLKILGFCT